MFFKTSLSKNLYRNFAKDYQSFNPKDIQQDEAFVYVGNDGAMKLLASVSDGEQITGEIFAQGVSNDGWLEYLAVND